MPEATNIQMQKFCDERVRVRAESFRALLESVDDDKASIDSVYERAAGSNPWADSRTDGPPKLATQSDILTFNSIITVFQKFVAGTATVQDVSDFHNNWQTFQSMCVRPA
jgi:hypothetical protein